MIALPPFRGFVRTFVILCASVFILQQFAQYGLHDQGQVYGQMIRFLGLVPEMVFHGMVYQLVTWIFLHANLSHLLFNMFAFWMFASILEEIWGSGRFARFVFLSGIITGIILCLVSFLDEATYLLPTIGASGVIFAILMVTAKMFPNQIVLFMFIFPMKMRYFAYLLIGIEFYMLYSSNQYGISNIAHLSGALVGYVYASIDERRGGRGSGPKQSWWKQFKEKWHQRRMRKKLRVIRVDTKSQTTYH